LTPAPPGFDFAAWFEAAYRRHPRHSDRQIAQQYAAERIFRQFQPEEFDAGHVELCASDAYRREGGRFAPSLAKVFLDEAWRYRPPEDKPKQSWKDRV
jgi:hypothetical protein